MSASPSESAERDELAYQLKVEASHKPPVRFFLLRPSGEELRLKLLATSIGTDGCDHYLAVIVEDDLRNAATNRTPSAVTPAKVNE